METAHEKVESHVQKVACVALTEICDTMKDERNASLLMKTAVQNAMISLISMAMIVPAMQDMCGIAVRNSVMGLFSILSLINSQ